MNHVSDHDLERYHLGMVTDGDELATLEQHYLACPECATRAEEAAEYVEFEPQSSLGILIGRRGSSGRK